MGNNTQSRKWLLTINNPLDAGLSHEAIISKLQPFSLTYYCFADEIATTGTLHTHIFIYSEKSPIRFSTIKNRFPTAHIDKAYGSVQENRAYIRKEDKWSDTEKAETSLPETFYEWGEMPSEKEEASPLMTKVIQSIRDGQTTTEIIDNFPDLGLKVKDIEILRQTLLSDLYAAEMRTLNVTYIFGASGTGKTSGIFKRHNPRSICRVTNYRVNKGIAFDNYNNHEVLVFEEFNSQIPIEDMLNYLDIYPLHLPARYSDKPAAYTTVYITSNIPLTCQYGAEQIARPETYNAFLRRIHNIVEYTKDGEIIIHKGEF